MAISLDAIASAADTSVSSLTFSHTVGAGSNTMLIVTACARNTGTINNTVVTGVTYNGVAMTQAVAFKETGDGNSSSVWYLAAPATGANNVVITYTGTCSPVSGGAISLFGVAQSTPVDGSNSVAIAGSSANFSITTATDNCWIIDAAASGSTAISSYGAGQTSNWSQNNGGSSRKGPVTPAGATTMTINYGFAQGAYCGAAFKPAAGGGFTAKFRKTLSTVGTGVGKRQSQ